MHLVVVLTNVYCTNTSKTVKICLCMHATAQLCKHDIYITMFVNILYKIVNKSVYNFIDAGIKKI